MRIIPLALIFCLCYVPAPAAQTAMKQKLASGVLVKRQKYHEYEVKIYRRKKYGISEEDNLEILQNGKRVYFKSGGQFEIGINDEDDKEHKAIAVPMGKNVTGNNIPDLVITEWSGGAHCCFSYYIFELGQRFRLIGEIDAGNTDTSHFEDLDKDANLEFVTYDTTFAYWRASFADSPAPKVILHYQDGKYKLARDLMRQPAPSASDMEAKAKEVRGDEEWKKKRQPSELWSYMLDLIYSGYADLAWQFFDSAWPKNAPGKASFLADFKKTLAGSPYWVEVKELSVGKR